MRNSDLLISTELFGSGLNPTEVLVLALIVEDQINTGVCVKSNRDFADIINVSESTIRRVIKKLETAGIIISNGNKNRHLRQAATSSALEQKELHLENI